MFLEQCTIGCKMFPESQKCPEQPLVQNSWRPTILNNPLFRKSGAPIFLNKGLFRNSGAPKFLNNFPVDNQHSHIAVKTDVFGTTHDRLQNVPRIAEVS